ncbi:putative amine oxidase [Podospora didyma]|uniref:monoamine oxidase n=1 Tax=Podospora didyma TaxID=330526 RepID=A0AAE0TVG4_9PEZI|nr:putative amine oxidase [Podospora didyma]
MTYDPTTTDFDVVIVGAGLSGLKAAVDVHKSGLTCVALEAMDRVGGKTLSVDAAGPGIKGRGRIDLGAAWINDTSQTEMTTLAEQFGLELIRQRIAGNYLRQKSDGSVVSYALGFGDLIEHPKVLALHQMLIHLSEIWLGPDAKLLGSVTFKALAEANFPGEDAVSEAADFLAGAQFFSANLASLLPAGTVRLSSPVTKISQTSGVCITTTTNGTVFHSKKVILSVPTTLYHMITFEPPLPPPKQVLAQRTFLGHHAKTVLIFSHPWWRDGGLSGVMDSTSPNKNHCGPTAFTRDTSCEEDGQYSITCFIVGEHGRLWDALPKKERQKAGFGALQQSFWSAGKEPWVRGGPMPVMGMDVLDGEAGKALCEPFGDVHFVGAETASVWRGCMDGAVRSGIRGAEEVIGVFTVNSSAYAIGGRLAPSLVPIHNRARPLSLSEMLNVRAPH